MAITASNEVNGVAMDPTLSGATGFEAKTGTDGGANDPAKTMYAGYHANVPPYTMTQSAAALQESLNQNVFDPWGAGGRPVNGRTFQGPWIDTSKGSGVGVTNDGVYRDANGNFIYNQMLMTVAQNFDPFMQKKEAVHPHWWLNRIPRQAYKLFDGAVHETRIYRGGLSVYSGLSDWEDMAPDPTSGKACTNLPFKTYSYAWETRAWSGKKTAWGSDPICLDIFKFTPHAIEQLGWILETGVKFGTDIQNIWNRDMFIYHSVMAGRSYVMTREYRGAGSPRYIYEPYCKFVPDAQKGDLKASTDYVTKPFVVISAEAGGVEPINFDVLDIFRRQLERQCPEAAIGTIGNGKMYAIAMSEEDVEKYIRGNEEERRYWIEANPQALINHYGFAPTTFRRWTITCDGDQLRFKYKRYIPEYTEGEAENYGNVGLKELEGKPVYIAEVVDPEIAGKAGVNGSPVPEANPEYDLAELAIAPIFMNQVFTNQFVPDVTNLGHGTYFGPKKGLNGKWAWYNIQTKENPDMKVGNFKGEFEIVPKPELYAIYASSFIYRRCAEPLPSLCPAENPHVNVKAKTTGITGTIKSVIETVTAADENSFGVIAMLQLDGELLAAHTGEQLKIGDYDAAVLESLTGTKKLVQITIAKSETVATADAAKTAVAAIADADVTIG